MSRRDTDKTRHDVAVVKTAHPTQRNIILTVTPLRTAASTNTRVHNGGGRLFKQNNLLTKLVGELGRINIRTSRTAVYDSCGLRPFLNSEASCLRNKTNIYTTHEYTMFDWGLEFPYLYFFIGFSSSAGPIQDSAENIFYALIVGVGFWVPQTWKRFRKTFVPVAKPAAHVHVCIQ